MAFPTTWAQVWANLQFPTDPAIPFPTPTYKASCFWYGLVTGSVETNPADQTTLAENFRDILLSSYLGCGTPVANSSVSVYVRSPATNFDRTVLGPVGLNTWAGQLPFTHCATMRRLTAIPGRSTTGVFYLPGINASAVNSTTLLDAERDILEIFAQSFIQDVFGSTSLWRPHVESYKTSQFTPITRIKVSSRIAIIRKRARPRHYTNPQSNGPKPPPP